MKLFIITGASGGLGLELTKAALNNDDLVIGISRRSSYKHPNLYHLKHDLTSHKGLESKLDTLLGKLNLKKVKSIHLINNAAGIEPISLIGNMKEGISEQLSLNLITPIVLTNFVISRFKKKAVITNINSGAGVKPISGWSLYCSGKSGLRMFSDCLALEGVKSISFSPGIMDTNMQATLRKQKAKNFSRLREFKDFKAKNELLPADRVAGVLIELLDNSDSFNKVHYNVYDLL